MKFDTITLECLHGTFTRIMCTTVELFNGDMQEELMNRLADYPFTESIENFLHFPGQTVIYLLFELEGNDPRVEEIKDIIEDITHLVDYKED